MAISLVAVGAKITAAITNLIIAAVNAQGQTSVIPTTVTVGSGTGTVGAAGKVTFSAASTVSVNGCFTSTYDNYVIRLEVSGVSAQVLNLRMRAAGTDDSGSVYIGGFQNNASTTPSYSFATATSLPVGRVNNSTTAVSTNEYTFSGPNLARTTSVLTRATDIVVWTVGGGTVNTTTQYDGFTIIPAVASNLTGTIRIYGYNNN